MVDWYKTVGIVRAPSLPEIDEALNR